MRSHALGIDARRALTTTQIKEIARWRRRSEPTGIATARAEAVRLATRAVQLDTELKTNRDQITVIIGARAPELLEGKTRREIRRCLKRYTTRQIYRTLNAAHPPEELTPAA